MKNLWNSRKFKLAVISATVTLVGNYFGIDAVVLGTTVVPFLAAILGVAAEDMAKAKAPAALEKP